MTSQETFGANFFETTLSSAMGPTDLTASVVDTTGLAVPGYITIEPNVPARREVILFDSSLTATTLVASNINKRYLTGSAAGSGITHPENSIVRCSPVFQQFTDLHDRIDVVTKIASSAVGDTWYVSAVNGTTGLVTLTRVPKGTASQAYRMNAGATAPTWLTVSPTSATVATSQTTASDAFTDLATVGPAVTMTVPASGVVMIQGQCSVSNDTIGGGGYMGVSATGLSASTGKAFGISKVYAANNLVVGSFTIYATGLTPGSLTFTAKYRRDNLGTATFADRMLIVTPLP